MPGTIVFKPIKAELFHDKGFFTKMNTYCSIILGNQETKGHSCKHGGKAPHWSDALTVRRAYESTCQLKIMQKEFLKHDTVVGEVEIDLKEIEAKGKISGWYEVFDKGHHAGEIFIEATFTPEESGRPKQAYYQQDQHNYYQNSHSGTEKLDSPLDHNLYESRQIYQMPLANVTNGSGTQCSQKSSYPHYCHELTAEEYHKLHSRQPERYQSVKKTCGNQYHGSENIRQNLLTVQPESPKKSDFPSFEVGKCTPNGKERGYKPQQSPYSLGSLDNLDNMDSGSKNKRLLME